MNQRYAQSLGKMLVLRLLSTRILGGSNAINFTHLVVADRMLLHLEDMLRMQQ